MLLHHRPLSHTGVGTQPGVLLRPRSSLCDARELQ
jgi:hypothetical protein